MNRIVRRGRGNTSRHKSILQYSTATEVGNYANINNKLCDHHKR